MRGWRSIFRLSGQQFRKINLINKKKKNIYHDTVLVSNQKFTGENQVTRRYCTRPRHFCAGLVYR